MVARSGLFVAPLAGSPPVGTSPTDGRRVMGAMLGTAFQTLAGGGVAQSGSVMQFTVAQSVWGVPDPTDAACIFASPSDSTVLTGTAGPGSGSRIDSIAVKQNNVENGDADSRSQVILVAGTASGSPTPPTLAAGYSRYANIAVPTSAANAAACTVTILAPSTLAPFPIKVTTVALLNTITGTAAQHATVYSDGGNNGDYLWNGTGWVTTAGGLVPIIPTSVSTGTVSASGAVSFTTASPIALNGVFTSTYDNFLVILDVPTHSAGSVLQFRLRVGGVDDSTAAAYQNQVQTNTVSTASTAQSVGTVGLFAGSGASTEDSVKTTFFAPALARVTRWQSEYFSVVSSIVAGSTYGRHTQTVAYDGLDIIPSTGTITGTVHVYGYVK